MDKNPVVNIYKMIRELKIVPHKKRQEFLVEMLGGIIKSRSVLFSEIANSIDKPIERSSIERRIQDFFKKVSIDYQQLIRFFLGFVHHDKLTLSIDRTEWDFGKTQINILCVVVSIGKMAVPIYGSLTIFAFPIQRCLPRCFNYLKNSGASTTGLVKNQFVAKIVKEPNLF